MCILLVKAFPSTTSTFGPFAIGLVHRCEAKYRPVSIQNVYRTLLALDILPLVYALPVQLVQEQTHHGIPVPDFASSLGVVTSSLPEMKSLPDTNSLIAVTSPVPEMKSLQDTNASTNSHDMAHHKDPSHRNLQFPSHEKAWANATENDKRIVIQMARFVRGLEMAAAFHLARRDWRRLFELFLAAFSACGFANEEETQTVSDPVVTPDDFLGEMFGMHHEKSIRDEFAMPTMACCACLCALEYYKYIMGAGNEKCYIPIGNATTGYDAKKRKRPARSSASASSGSPPEPVEPISHSAFTSDTNASHTVNNLHSTSTSRDVMKVTNLINPPEADRIAMPPPAIPRRNGQKPLPKSQAFQKPVSRAVQARKWLDRLRRCVSHMAASWPHHHQVLTEYVKMFDLPFEVHNAILLARGDLAFSDDRYDMAIDMYQMLQDRIVTAWEHRQQQPKAQMASGLMTGGDPSDDLKYQMEKMHLHEAGVKSMTPTLLPFMVLYRTALAASAADGDMDPRAELLFLLSTLPFQTLTQAQFDRDAEVMAASAIPNTDTSTTKLRLVQTDPTALATRALKHLSSLLVHTSGDCDDQLLAKLQDLFTVSDHASSRLPRSVLQSVISLFWWNIENRRQGLDGSALEDSSEEEANIVS